MKTQFASQLRVRVSDNIKIDRDYNYKLSPDTYSILDMKSSTNLHQGAVIDSIFQPTDQVLSVQTQESAKILSILGSQSTEPNLENHFDKMIDTAAG